MSMSSANLWVRDASLLLPAGPACLCADFDLQFDQFGGGLVALPGAALLEAYERAAGANAAQHGLLRGAEAGLATSRELAAAQLQRDGPGVGSADRSRPSVARRRETPQRKDALLADGEHDVRRESGVAQTGLQSFIR